MRCSWHATPSTSNIPASTIPAFLSATSRIFTGASPRSEANPSAAGDVLAQDFELQPLLLGRGNLHLKLAERGNDLFEAGAVARIELRIVQLRLQRLRLGL